MWLRAVVWSEQCCNAAADSDLIKKTRQENEFLKDAHCGESIYKTNIVIIQQQSLYYYMLNSTEKKIDIFFELHSEMVPNSMAALFQSEAELHEENVFQQAHDVAE